MNLRLQQIRIEQAEAAAKAKAKAEADYIKFAEQYENKPKTRPYSVPSASTYQIDTGLPEPIGSVNDYAVYMGAVVSQPTTPSVGVNVYHTGDINQQILDAEAESERRQAERERYATNDTTSTERFARIYQAIMAPSQTGSINMADMVDIFGHMVEVTDDDFLDNLTEEDDD